MGGSVPEADSRAASAANAVPSFSQVARASGVLPLGPGPRRIPSPKRAAAPRSAPAPDFTVSADDGFIEGARRGLGASALLPLRGTPRATLDLHGLRVAVAERRFATFLAEASASGAKLVLVIVGKGRHSPGGAGVLRGAIAEWLTASSAAAYVLAFRTAPPALGGSGGVLVLLKGDGRR